MLSTLTIAKNAFVESTRQPIYLVMVVLSGVFQYLNTAMSAYSMGLRNVDGEVTGDNKLLFDIGMATVFGCGILLAAFIATATMSREIENKTVLTVVSKPVGRASVVIGKFLGVAASMAIAITMMTIFLLYAIRHGVLTNAGDDIDWPIITFGVGGIALAVAFGAATNYLYGRSFTQMTLIALVPLQLLGWGLSLIIGSGWEVQNISTDLKPNILKACFGMGVAILVMSAVATAASTRLGQVMTIVVCAGVMIAGLLSNHVLGRLAFLSQPYAQINQAAPPAGEDPDATLTEVGDVLELTLVAPPDIEIVPRDPLYFGPAPNGIGMVTPPFAAPGPEVDLDRTLFTRDVDPALVVLSVEFDRELAILTVKHIGAEPLPLSRGPEEGDWLFTAPQQVNWPARLAWSLVPNLHALWLVDAVTQASNIPLQHMFMVALYGLLQIAAALSVAVLLFQSRDVG